MITALEAKNRSNENLFIENTEKLNKIAHAIEGACSLGLRKIEIPLAETNDFITKFLEEKGYTLFYLREEVLEISW